MCCKYCGAKVNSSDKFCMSCGQSTSSDNKGKKFILTILLYIVNSISMSFCSLYCAAILATIFLALIVLLFWPIMVMLSGQNIDIFDRELVNFLMLNFIPFLFTVVLSVIFNIRMFKSLKNIYSNETAKLENKIKVSSYLIFIYLTGFLGIHRFKIKDIIGGLLRLTFFITSVITLEVLKFPNFKTRIYASFLFIGLVFGFMVSDSIIALCKKRDSEGYIYF